MDWCFLEREREREKAREKEGGLSTDQRRGEERRGGREGYLDRGDDA
jgi:hypothetical protein